MATLSIDRVYKTFGRLDVLKGIDLTLEEGDFLVLLGPSGCGKSTLLNMIAGLETVTSGEIRIDGRVVNNVHPKDRDIAMVFQSYALYPNMTVAGNITFGLKLRGASKAECQAAVSQVAELLEIEHLLDRKPAQLSGGQRQRVAMGRALVRNPRIFLFDEPLSSLDAKLRVDLRTEIKKLHQRLRTTVVYVTHDQIEAMTLATRIAILRDGVIQQCASPRNIYEYPANMYVAGFIGSPTTSFLPAVFASEGGRPRLRVTGRSEPGSLFLPLPSAADQAGRAGQPVMVGIRPEAITRWDPAAAAANPALARVTCRVQVLEMTGADMLTHIGLDGLNLIARLNPRVAPHEGETADFMIDMSRVNLFDAATEQRIMLNSLSS